MALQVYNFSECCGIKIIAGFGKTASASRDNNAAVSTTEKELKNIIADYSDKSLYGSVGLLLVALNEEQVPIFQDDLINHKFFPMMGNSFYHTNHNKNITLYGRVSHEEETNGKMPEKKVAAKKDVTQAKVKVSKSRPTGGNALDWRWTNK